MIPRAHFKFVQQLTQAKGNLNDFLMQYPSALVNVARARLLFLTVIQKFDSGRLSQMFSQRDMVQVIFILITNLWLTGHWTRSKTRLKIIMVDTLFQKQLKMSFWLKKRQHIRSSLYPKMIEEDRNASQKIWKSWCQMSNYSCSLQILSIEFTLISRIVSTNSRLPVRN